MPTHLLTHRKELFCQQYIVDFNGAQAAIRAGYKEKTARQVAHEMLAQDIVKNRIDELLAERIGRVKVTQDMVIKELWGIATDSVSNYVSIKPKRVAGKDPATAEETEESMRVTITVKDLSLLERNNIAEMSVNRDGLFKFRLQSRENALLQLAKHLGMFTEKKDEKKEPENDEDYPGTVPVIIFPRAHNNPPGEAC